MPSINRASVKLLFRAKYVGATANVNQAIADSFLGTFANGTGTSQANRAYQTTLTIAASGNGTVNLASFTDNLGNACALTKVNAIFVTHKSTSAASQVTVGGGSNPLFGTKIAGIEVKPGDTFPFVCKSGYTVSSGSADTIRVVNSDASNAASVLVTILGSQ